MKKKLVAWLGESYIRRDSAAPLDGSRVLPLARDAPGATILVGEPPYPALLEKAKRPAEANVSFKGL